MTLRGSMCDEPLYCMSKIVLMLHSERSSCMETVGIYSTRFTSEYEEPMIPKVIFRWALLVWRSGSVSALLYVKFIMGA